MATKTSPWLVASAHVLDSAVTVKATTWQEAADEATKNVMSGQLVCIPALVVQRFRVESQPSRTITAE